ncbi:MAG: hypothetical protein V4517_08460 [Pseudomonadota bacterium]
MDIMTATIDRKFLILWLKSKEPSAHVGECLAELDALTDAIDELDVAAVDFLMKEIGKADLDVTRELAKILEEPEETVTYLCFGQMQPQEFSFVREVRTGARNCRPGKKQGRSSIKDRNYPVKMKTIDIGSGSRCSSSTMEIPEVQQILAHLTARREKERNLDCD